MEHSLLAARNGWIIALDNLSGIQPWLSDGLCRLSTGGGFSARELYSDADEILIDVSRPVCVNGIDALATRPDLADRAIVVTLERIADSARRSEADLWRAFNAAAPCILGGLLDAVVCAIRNVDDVRLAVLPRMADHVIWVEAASPALGWHPGEYADEYAAGRDAIVGQAADSSPVATSIMTFIDSVRTWTGTASDLLAELSHRADQQATRSKHWPGSAVGMGNTLTRLAPALRARGYTVDRLPGRRNGRQLVLGLIGNAPSSPSSPVPPSSNGEDRRTAGDGEDSLSPINPNFALAADGDRF